MPIRSSFDIEGDDEIVSAFERIADALTRNIASALREAADLIVSNAQANAPVDTGFLQDNIQITSESDTSITVTSEAGYSGFVEYGTSRMSAQPFFEPAIEEARSEIEQIFRDAISGSL